MQDMEPLVERAQNGIQAGMAIKRSICMDCYGLPSIWIIVTILTGLGFVTIACSPDWVVAVVGEVLPTTISRALFVLFGFILMSHAVVPYQIAKIATSSVFGSLYSECSVADADFTKAFDEEVNTLSTTPLKSGVLGVLMYGFLAWCSFGTTYSILVFGSAGLVGVLGRAATRFIGIMTKMCNLDVDSFILKMIQDKTLLAKDVDDQDVAACFKRKVNWEYVAKEHYSLDLRLERLWAPALGGALLVHTIAVRCAVGGLLLVLGVILEQVRIKVAFWLVGAFFLILRVPDVLQEPAALTTRCCSSSPRFGLKAIKVVVNGFSCNGQGQSQQLDAEGIPHLKFLQYLNSTTTGVELFGILVTPALVLHLMIGFATNLPIAVGILQGLVTSRKEGQIYEN